MPCSDPCAPSGRYGPPKIRPARSAWRSAPLIANSARWLNPACSKTVEGSRAYVLGPAINELDHNIRLGDPLITVATPAMR